MKSPARALAAGCLVLPILLLNASRQDWINAGTATLQELIDAQYDQNTDQARNVVLFVGDGAGPNTLYAARLYKGQQNGNYGDEEVLAMEALPNLAMAKVYNTNAQSPDSAGTASAMMTGVKTKSSVIGVDESVVRGNCQTLAGATMPKFAQYAKARGMKVGLISNVRLTHATPASVYASTVDRNYESFVPQQCRGLQTDHATQLIEAMIGQGDFVDFAMGGGRSVFQPSSNRQNVRGGGGGLGGRPDGVDLVQRFRNSADHSTQYASDTASFNALDLSAGGKILGLFADNELAYNKDSVEANEPSLADMTEAAITFLGNNNNNNNDNDSNDDDGSGGDGFFLLVEGGHIDIANHAGNLQAAVTDTMAYEEAFIRAQGLTSTRDTLLISTADHASSLVLNGYCGRGSDILGLCMDIDGSGEAASQQSAVALDDRPYTVVTYGSGPGSILLRSGPNRLARDGTRQTVTAATASGDDYIREALLPFARETHSGVDVAIYASGPWSHLFKGTMEQTMVFYVMMKAISETETTVATAAAP